MILLISLLLFASMLLVASLIPRSTPAVPGMADGFDDSPSPLSITRRMQIFLASFTFAVVLQIGRFRRHLVRVLYEFTDPIRSQLFLRLFGRGILHG